MQRTSSRAYVRCSPVLTVIHTGGTSICQDVEAINWDECPTRYKHYVCQFLGHSYLTYIHGIDSITFARGALYLPRPLTERHKSIFWHPDRTNRIWIMNAALRCPAIELYAVYKYFIVHFIACAIKKHQVGLRQWTTIKMQHACDALQLRCII